MNNLIIFIDSLLLGWILTYTLSKATNIKINYNDKKYYLFLAIIVFYLTLSYIITDSFIKIIFTFSILILTSAKLFKQSYVKSILFAFVTLFINLCSEIIYALFVISFMDKDLTYIKSNMFGTLFSNLIITVINFVLVSVIFSPKKINTLFQKIKIKNVFSVVLFAFMSIISLAIILYFVYFDVSLLGAFVLGLFLICTFFLTMISFMVEKSKKEEIAKEYNITLNSLSEYEKLYSYQRKLTHEFRNDLMVIRGMANKNNKKLLNYIDEISDIKSVEESNWLNELKKIPEGGLLGILYYKLLTTDKFNINTRLEIFDSFKSKKYNNLDDEIKNKVCKLIGIFLDNAIDAVNKSKEKYITIEIGIEKEYITFKIANNFSGSCDFSKIYDEGYSTNGVGRGYGLALAKKIIDSEGRIENKIEIKNNIFIQILKIKV